MTTSSSYNHSISATEIITDALFKCGGAQEGEDIPYEQTASALRQLNNLVKFLSTKTRNLWRRDEVYVFLNKSQYRYLLGPETTDAEWCNVEDFVATKLNGAAISGATSLTVDSTTGMTDADRLGLELTDGTRSWMALTTVVNSTTLTVPAISGAASDNATVYTYTTRPQRPLRVLHARRRANATASDIPLEVEDQEYFRDQTSKDTNGTPIFVTYKPTLTSGRLEIWQSPSSIQTIIGLTMERPFEDFDAGANTPDFPQEWYDPLVWLLADRLEPEYRTLDPIRLKKLSSMADEMLAWVNNFDSDGGSIYIEPA